jgi:elongation factor Ts
MAQINSADVGKLREKTGAGMMDCKKALTEADGDFEKAVDIIRKKNANISVKASSREAREGVIVRFITPDSRAGILVEVNCVTDFVGRNDEFRAFAADVAKRQLANPGTDFEAERAALVAKTGENIKIARHHAMTVTGNGLVAAYIHTGEKVGVLVEVGAGKAETLAREEFKQLVRDITLQIAAASPTSVTRDEVKPAVLAKEREILAEQVKGKPPQIVENIVKGKLEKFFQTHCLVDQVFVKAEESVKDHIAAVARQLGDEVAVRRFVRFQVGEVTE